MSASSSSVQKQLHPVMVQKFPTEPAARVKYSMAVAAKGIAQGIPTEIKPFTLRGGTKIELLYIWTALIIFGKRNPDPQMRFTYKAIAVMSRALNLEDLKKEHGYFSTFSKNSLYETQFKHYLTDDMLMIGKNLLEIDNIIESIENQEEELETRAIETEPNTQPIKTDSITPLPQKEPKQHTEYDYLIQLYLHEKEEFQKAPEAYKWTVNNFYKIITSDTNNKDWISKSPSDCPSEWAAFYMTWAIKSIHLYTPPTANNQLYINFSEPNMGHQPLVYCWTALMILGMILPDKNFGSESIDYEKNKDSNAQISQQQGYFSRFSSNSNYESLFKPFITQSIIEGYLERSSIKSTAQKRDQEILINTQKRTLETIERVSYKIITLDEETIDTEEIKRLLSNNQNQSEEHKNTETDIDINSKDKESGNTILIQAILRNKHRIAEHLLMLGADPAIKNNNYQIASDLAPKDAPLYLILKGYELIYASFNNNITNVKLILDKGADVNFQGLGGYTPLLIAAEQNFTSLTEFLLLSGADISLTRADGQGIFDLVTDKDLVPFDSSFYMTLKGHELIHAASNGDLKKVKLILDQGVDINFRSLGEYTPLLIAVEQNFPELTELLLESGADTTLTRSDGQGIFDLVTDTRVYAVLNKMVSPMYGELSLEEDDSTQASRNPYYFFSAIQSTLSNVTHRIQNMFTYK